MDTAALIRRYERLRADRATHDSTWQGIADYLLPEREFTQQSAPGQQRSVTRIYNTTPVLACEQLAGGLHGMLTSPALRWFSLRPQDERFAEDDEAAEWFEACTDRLYHLFNSPVAGFATAMHELYLDIAAFGTGVLYLGDRGPRRGMRFEARPLVEAAIAEGEDGRVDTLYRCYTLPAREVVRVWPRTAPRSVTEKVEKEPDKPVKILHAVTPAPEGERGPRFRSRYLVLDDKAPLEEGGYHEFPYAVARWSKRSGEVYGAGPGLKALPDVKLVNKLEELVLRGASKVVDPPLLLPDEGFLGPVDVRPGGLNYARLDTQGMDRIGPLVTGARPDIGRDEVTAVETRVRSTFYVDWLNLPTRPNMTATEVLQRRDEQLRLLGPMVARLQTELLGPVIERAFAVMFRNGLLPQMPQSLMGQDYRVEYLSPLALSQKGADADAATRFIAGVMQLAQLDAAALDVLDVSKAARFLADRYGAPATIVRSEAEAAEVAAGRADALAAQQQIAGAQGIAAAAKDGAGALAGLRQAMEPMQGAAA